MDRASDDVAEPPVVTVVIPTRDRRDLLEQTLDSVLAQVDAALTVVVVDEGSSDGTATYLAGHADPRVSVVTHAQPRGLATARNAGLARASTEWVAFTDDDDLWAPTKLAAQLAALRRDDGSRWSCVGAVWVDARLRPINAQRPSAAEDTHRELLVVNTIPGGGSGVVVRTELLREIGGFDADPDIAATADWDCWIRLAQRSRLAVVDAPLLAYRVAAGSMSRNSARMERALDGVRARHADLARTLGVDQDRGPADRYLASLEARAGRRLDPLRRLAGLAWRERRPQPLLRGLAIACSPRGALGARRLLAQVTDRGWFAASEAWLAPIRAAATPGRR